MEVVEIPLVSGGFQDFYRFVSGFDSLKAWGMMFPDASQGVFGSWLLVNQISFEPLPFKRFQLAGISFADVFPC